MSPGNWVAILLGIVALCWAAGVYLEIASHQADDARAQVDMEAMLKADSRNATHRPGLRAGTEPLLTEEKS